MTDIEDVLTEMAKAADPVNAIRRLVLAHGGTWTDAENATGLFEVQLAGVVGIGPSAATAVDDWLQQAKKTLG